MYLLEQHFLEVYVYENLNNNGMWSLDFASMTMTSFLDLPFVWAACFFFFFYVLEINHIHWRIVVESTALWRHLFAIKVDDFISQNQPYLFFLSAFCILLVEVSWYFSLLQVICTLGSVVFASILLIRGIWTGISYFQETRSYRADDDEPQPWSRSQPAT